jgi:hypothetical protein
MAFPSEEEEATGEWRNLHYKKVHNMCSSDAVSVIKSMRKGRIWEFWSENLK